eukprot:4659218-Prymnesium_polylepis.1
MRGLRPLLHMHVRSPEGFWCWHIHAKAAAYSEHSHQCKVTIFKTEGRSSGRSFGVCSHDTVVLVPTPGLDFFSRNVFVAWLEAAAVSLSAPCQRIQISETAVIGCCHVIRSSVRAASAARVPAV